MILSKAVDFARDYHGDQLRKYTNELYIFHPIRVGFMISTSTRSETVIAAAILHDILEDTKATYQDIFNNFGETVAIYVNQVSNLHKGNRKERKRLYREQLLVSYPAVKSIKLADMIDNAPSIIKHDPDFAKVWMAEQKELLPCLSTGDMLMYMRVKDIIDNYFEKT